MVENKTNIQNIGDIDSTLSDEAVQKIRVETDYEELDENMVTFTKCLIKADVISSSSPVKSRKILLEIKNAEPNEHSLADYNGPIAVASYKYYPEEEVGQVGSVFVDHQIQNFGIGTQMKKQLDNHLRQDGAKISYTWIASEAGRKLAKKTGYTSDKENFSDEDKIWSKRFDR